jgi:hypothetical protein
VKIFIYTVVALVAFFVAYGLNLGSDVSALIFLAVLMIGVVHRTAEPILTWIRG